MFGNLSTNPTVIRPDGNTDIIKDLNHFFAGWDGTENMLKTDSIRGCYVESATLKSYCTKLIQLNGWEIPEDYPWKVSY